MLLVVVEQHIDAGLTRMTPTNSPESAMSCASRRVTCYSQNSKLLCYVML